MSRQRYWGVPITLFTHQQTGELHPNTLELMEQAAQRIEQGGIDAWFELDPAELLGADAADYDKVTDTLDVWFDSGTTHFSVLDRRPELHFPAELYLEGSDQHRGWFQSSLLASVAMRGVAPYKGLLTHGFTVDAQGRKMAKSLGNVIAPQKVIHSLGADVLRLWVAATDYRGEMGVSDEILKRMADSYRRMRNTARFLLANLNGFDPARRSAAAGADAGAGPLGGGSDPPLAGGDSGGLRPVPVPPDLPEDSQLLLGGPGQPVSGHPQGSPVHHRARQRRPPLGADRDVSHSGSDDALAGADSELHRRGNLAEPARRARSVGVPDHLVYRAVRGRRRRTARTRPTGTD